MWQYWSHFKYTTRHKYYVLMACMKKGIFVRGILHDMSKFSSSEFSGYANFFFNIDGSKKKNPKGENTTEIIKAFDDAWLHHQMSNDHHWQYWIQKNGIQTIINKMPNEAMIEMICDWEGAALANYQNHPNIPVPWYKDNRSKVLLHIETRQDLENKIGFN